MDDPDTEPDDTTTSDTSATAGQESDDFRPGGGGGHPGEEPLTGETAAQVEAAALEEYPGATVVRLENDSDAVYEAHLETAEGTRVTVEVGEDFVVTGEEGEG